MSFINGGQQVFGVLSRLYGLDNTLNTNSTSDQILTKLFPFTTYRITEIVVRQPGSSLATILKTLAIRTATGGGGTAIVVAQNLTGLTTTAGMITCTLATSDIRTDANLYALLSAGTGVATTASIDVNGYAFN